jgi:hypothetical protein
MKRKSGVRGEDQLNRGDVKVGYANPPRHTRFKPGVSGNPKGRPKWSEDGQLGQLLGREIYRLMRIQENGTTRSMPAVQIGIRRLAISAAKGEPSAVKAMVGLAQYQEQAASLRKDKFPSMTNQERDERVLALLQGARLRNQKKEAAKLDQKHSGQKSIA